MGPRLRYSQLGDGQQEDGDIEHDVHGGTDERLRGHVDTCARVPAIPPCPYVTERLAVREQGHDEDHAENADRGQQTEAHPAELCLRKDAEI